MFVVSMKTTRPRLAAYGVVLALLVLVTALLAGRDNTSPTVAKESADPVAYLTRLGYAVEPQWIDLREITIPAEFDEIFSAYNEMQKQAGFDLSPYRGQRVKQYVYRVGNYPTGEAALATVYLHRDQVIAGDISAAEQGGFSHGLKPMEDDKKDGATG